MRIDRRALYVKRTREETSPTESPERVQRWVRSSNHLRLPILSPETGHPRDYGLNPYAQYQQSPGVIFPTSSSDRRLKAKELVLGVVVDGIPRAYPLRRLSRLRWPLRDRFKTSELLIQYDPATRTAEPSVGARPLPATVVYWFAWTAFHPETGLWKGPDGDEAVSARAGDVSISELKEYWSTLMGVLTDDPVRRPNGPASLYVISGILKNTSTLPVHHVELSFELLDPRGAVVYRQAGFNRSAEALRPSMTGESRSPAVKPILPGATDSFRMLLFGDELPEFAETRVTVVRVE